MSSNFWEREPDDWHLERYLIQEFRINENIYMVKENVHIYDETDEIIYHSIQIQRSYVSQKGRRRFSNEKINIPFDKFSEFCQILNEINDKEYLELLNTE
jgi:hypothetical protein